MSKVYGEAKTEGEEDSLKLIYMYCTFTVVCPRHMYILPPDACLVGLVANLHGACSQSKERTYYYK